MSVRYAIPGVYFEKQDPPRTGGRIRTDIAGFVGVTTRGPFNEPTKIESWDQFVTRFGGETRAGYLAFAVRAFFDNGGRTCYAVRVGDPNWASAATADIPVPGQTAMLVVTALDPTLGADAISVQLIPRSAGRFTLVVRLNGVERERWHDLTVDENSSTDSRSVDRIFRKRGSQSALIHVAIESGVVRRPAVAEPVRLRATGSGTITYEQLKLSHFTGEDAENLESEFGLKALEQVTEVSIVAIPDLVWLPPVTPEYRLPPPQPCGQPRARAWEPPTGLAETRQPLSEIDLRRGREALVSHCAILRDRFAILDPLPSDTPEQVVRVAREIRNASDWSTYAAMYYPWLRLPDAIGETAGSRIAVPPSGAVAGVMARVDRTVGVHKAPANERIVTAFDLDRPLSDPERARLHEGGVNAVVPVPGRGLRIMGGRTLAGPDRPEWRFVNVRRLLIMIETAIARLGHHYVFEGNNTTTRADVTRIVTGYLDDLWREGQLAGRTATEAYSVTCDETTNPREVIDAGQLVCEIGVQPPLPAEFVIVRIGLISGETQEVAGAHNG